jgi:hypothetical protein
LLSHIDQLIANFFEKRYQSYLIAPVKVATDVYVGRTMGQTLMMNIFWRHIDVAKACASNPLGKWQKAKRF